MIKNFKDYGIIILKPDGVKKNLMNECEQEIANNNIRIISKKKLLLTRQQVLNYFYYNFDEYVDYMCEDMIIAYFLEAYNIDLDIAIYFIKKKIRAKQGVDGQTLRNYIHGTHCGTEFFLQRGLLFPEFEKYEYSSGLDMYCKIEEFDLKVYEKICEIRDVGNLSKIIFDIPEKQEREFCDIVLNKHLNDFIFFSHTQSIVFSNMICDIIYYYPNVKVICQQKYIKPLIFLGKIYNLNLKNNIGESLQEYNCTYMLYIENKLNSIIEYLNKNNICIKGILINLADMSLQEAECRYEYAKLKNYFISGGSSTLDNLGLFTMSYNKMKPIINYLNSI